MYGIEEHNDYISGLDDTQERYTGEGENPEAALWEANESYISDMVKGFPFCRQFTKLGKAWKKPITASFVSGECSLINRSVSVSSYQIDTLKANL